MPAPPANLNAARNGTRIHKLTIGVLPKTMARQTANARRYRKNLEQAVIDDKGEVSLRDAHLIDECAAAEIHCAIQRWLLRDRLDKMTTSEISACSEQILKSKRIRNSAFDKLGLGVQQENLIEALYDYGSDTGERMPQDGQEADKMTQPPHQDSKPSDGQSEDGSQDDE